MALSKIDVSKMITGVTPLTNGGTGGTSIPATNLASGVTGTLPVGSGGTGLTSGTTDQILKFTGSTTLASAAEAAGGKIHQVVRVTGGAELMTSSTYNSTGLYATITPSAATSSLVVWAYSPRQYINNVEPLNFQLWKGTSGEASGSVVQGGRTVDTDGGQVDNPSTMTAYIPASGVTTSATTFTVMHANSNNSTLVGWFQALTGTTGELVIMEILA